MASEIQVVVGGGDKAPQPLPPALVEKAQTELNEKPDGRQKDISALREMVEKYPGLKARVDDSFLLRFLRARKFDYDRALKLIVAYYQVKSHEKEVFANLLPSRMTVQFEQGMAAMLPDRDREGRRVFYFRPGKWDPAKMSLVDIFRFNALSLEHVIREEETQVNGIVMIGNMQGFGMKHAKHISPWYAKRMNGLLQDSFPARVKAIHIINEPKIFDVVFAIMKPFMKEKLRSRINFHGGDYDSLHKHFDPEMLPEELQGKKPAFTNQWWKKQLLDSEEYHQEQAKYFLDDKQSLGQERGADASAGLQGSFKKLSVD